MDLSVVFFLPVAIVGALAAAFWLVALVLLLRALILRSRGVRVQGKVVGYTEGFGRRGRRRMYSAIYEATVSDGRTLRCTSGIAKSWQSPPVGTVVTLRYRADDPSEPLAVFGFDRFLFCIVFGGVATVLTLVSITLFATISQTAASIPTGFGRPPGARTSTSQPRR